MIEVEIKVAISNLGSLKENLKKLNGKYIISLDHEDTYFNMPRKLRNFKKTDEALRLRKSIEFNKNNKKNTTLRRSFITYKGKKIDQTTKTREEIEVEIVNLEKMKKLFENLGFREIFTIKKERELYEFNFKNEKIEVLIDFLPILNQNFMEVEVIVESKKDVPHVKEKLFEFLKRFGISKNDSIRESYLELIAKKLKLE
ncbi:MAG: class IV adenylate cyclase [Promethearchaeota archaeon]|jgi:adenylate cyclase class 2